MAELISCEQEWKAEFVFMHRIHAPFSQLEICKRNVDFVFHIPEIAAGLHVIWESDINFLIAWDGTVFCRAEQLIEMLLKLACVQE